MGDDKPSGHFILGMRRSYTLYAKTAFYAVRRTFYSVIVEKELKLLIRSADKIQPAKRAGFRSKKNGGRYA